MFKFNGGYYRNDEIFLLKSVDFNEEKCFIDESYYLEYSWFYYLGSYGYRGRN